MYIIRTPSRANTGDSISLCMIMKNEEKLLPRCLDSIQDLVQEIIITDTGSTDRSREIAQTYGAKVIDDPWQDDFSRPRNIAIDQATKNWIFILDPDEVVSRKDHQTIREHTLRPDIIAWRMDTRNYGTNPWQQGMRPNPKDFFAAERFAGYVPSCKTRLFQNWKGIHFKGVWHELADHDVAHGKHRNATSPVPIHHYPHEINQATIQQKKEFYLRLGEKKVQLEPNNDQAWWELAIAEHIIGYHHRAYVHCLKSLRGGHYKQDRLFFLASCAKNAGQAKIQKIAFEKAVCMIFPNLTHIDEKKHPPLQKQLNLR